MLVNFAESRFRRDLEDLVDGRLDEARRARLESHLERCEECWRARQALASIRTAVRDTRTEGLPSELAGEIRAALDREDRAEEARSPFLRGRRGMRFLAVAATAAAVIAAVFLLARPQPSDLPSSAAHDWRRWTSGRLHLELRSQSPTAVSSFFSQRDIGFPVEPESLEIPGYRLVGARAHSFAGRISALSVYRGGRDQTLVCQMYEGRVGDLPTGGRVVERGDARFYVFQASDLTQVFWQDGPLVCAIVSDITAEELVQLAFAKAMRT